jgi:predicted GIY-YIG superfamily endonuclease
MVKMASSKFLALKWSCSLGKNEAAVSCEKNFQKVKRKILKAYFATVFAVFGNNPA